MNIGIWFETAKAAARLMEAQLPTKMYARPHLSSITPWGHEPQVRSKMDLVTVFGFAANLIDFINFSWNLAHGSYEVYKSALDMTAESAHISMAIEDLKEVTKGLHSDLRIGGKICKTAVQACRKLACRKTSSRSLRSFRWRRKTRHGRLWR